MDDRQKRYEEALERPAATGPEEQWLNAVIFTPPAAEHPSGHVPGCRMPGCEGECTTDSGLSPAEERMLAEWPEHPSGSPQTEAGRFLHDRCGYLLACPCWTDGATAGQAAARREPLDMERPTRDELIEALIWMTGSDHFSPGGMAHEGFEKVVRPVLRALSSIPAREEK